MRGIIPFLPRLANLLGAVVAALVGQSVVLIDVDGLPRVVDPDIADGAGGSVSALDHILGQSTLLGLVLVLSQKSVKSSFRILDALRQSAATYMEDKDAKLSLGLITTHLLTGLLNILLELLDGILESGTGVIDLIDNQDALANKVLERTKGSQVEPLGTGDLGSGSLNLGIVSELLVQGQANSLDGNVGRAGLLEERSEDTGGNVTTTSDSDHELGLELGQQLGGRLLAELVYLFKPNG